jgi:MSHA biogenesis protein MshE
MTGHLVFSTLHTQDAVSAVSRMLDMGAQGYLIAAALDGVLAQRLVRRICDNCARPAELAVHQVAWLSRYMTAEQIRATKFVEGSGCTYCNTTGYKGRIGVYELIEVDAPMADAMRRGDLSELDRLASQAKGFVPLVQRALQHARDGVTSVEEVMKSMSGLEEYERASLLDDVLSASADAPAGSAERLTG